MGLKSWWNNIQLKVMEASSSSSIMDKVQMSFRSNMVRDVKWYEKKHGRKPTIDELCEPYKSNPMLMSSAASLGISMDIIEKYAREALEE